MSSGAHALVKQADAKLKGGFLNCLGGTRRFEEASELYQQAAVQLKLAKDWHGAASCYKQCAYCAQQTADTNAEADAHQEAGNLLKRISTAEAIDEYEQAVALFGAAGRFQQAGKLLKAMAELYEAEKLDGAEAGACYKRAAEMFALDDHGKSSLTACNLKVAEFAAKDGEFKEAIRIFESEGEKALQNAMLQYGAKEHFLRAGILHLVVGDPVNTSIAIEKYGGLDPRFSSSREGELLAGLAEACEAGDVDMFVHRLGAYDAVTKLDPWKTEMLLKVKNTMQPADGGGGALESVDLS